MTYFRKLPSGLWQATVRGPDGRRHTHTDKLKSVVRQWATDQESRFSKGDLRDPRAGQIKVGDWYARREGSRSIEAPTRAKNASLWATHCEPEWASWQMSAVTRMEAQAWVSRLRATKRARHQGKPASASAKDIPVLSAATIADIVHLMSSLYRAAGREDPPIVVANPFAELELPKAPAAAGRLLRARRGRRALRGDAGSAVADADRAGHAGRSPVRGAVRSPRAPGGLAARAAGGGRRDDAPGPAPVAEVETVAPHRPGFHRPCWRVCQRS